MVKKDMSWTTYLKKINSSSETPKLWTKHHDKQVETHSEWGFHKNKVHADECACVQTVSLASNTVSHA